MKGLDLSKWDKGINFTTIKESGCSFVILRAGFTGWGTGNSLNKDECFENFYVQAKAVGLNVGAYYFTIAENYQEGCDEANWMIEHCLKGKKFEMPIYIDVEDDTGGKQYLRKAGKQNVTDAIVGFCETLEKAGYYAGVYASDVSGFKDMFNYNQIKDRYTRWVARYGSTPKYVEKYEMWQKTSTHRIAGFNKDLDLNECYVDYPTIIKKGGFNGYTKEETKPEPTPEVKPEVNSKYEEAKHHVDRITAHMYALVELMK